MQKIFLRTQIKAPRVTPLEGVSTYAPQGIRVRGVENPQGFGIDERRFIARAYIALVRLFFYVALCKNQEASPQSAQSPQR